MKNILHKIKKFFITFMEIDIPVTRAVMRGNVDVQHTKIDADRWIFSFKVLWPERILWIFPAFTIGFMHQYRSVESGWRCGAGYYAFNMTAYWHWGRSHNYYDGPHDGFSLGYLHYTWSGDWCDKCYGDA